MQTLREAGGEKAAAPRNRGVGADVAESKQKIQLNMKETQK